MKVLHIYAGIEKVYDHEIPESNTTSTLTQDILEFALAAGGKTNNPLAIVVPLAIRHKSYDAHWNYRNIINASSLPHDSIEPIESAVILFAHCLIEIHCRRLIIMNH